MLTYGVGSVNFRTSDFAVAIETGSLSTACCNRWPRRADELERHNTIGGRMGSVRDNIQSILRNWKGEDYADQSTPREIADRIDQEYRAYIASLPAKTAAIQAGQDANERRVA